MVKGRRGRNSHLTGQKENKEDSYNEHKQQSKVYIKVVIRPT